MDCDKCGKPAKVHLTQLVGGQVKKVALCNECAAQSGVTDPTGFALADMLLGDGTVGKTPSVLPPKPSVSKGRSCPECGFTLEDLKRIRRFGCGNCYVAFRDEVNDMIRGMHKGATHCGKVPDGLMEMRQRKLRLTELRERLDHAISAENYEEAAGLRDEIRQIEVALEETEP
ncbi:excinuclease ABC subunit B [Haloferula helveola]|uniref:Excinuclease ABC subunit B n=1 Tax=Haloferula helveola TaxID=490095 RepID=A0ABN6HE77_9BACT|nr:excinuclease ABC subunit B [Haloferula helveola]